MHVQIGSATRGIRRKFGVDVHAPPSYGCDLYDLYSISKVEI